MVHRNVCKIVDNFIKHGNAMFGCSMFYYCPDASVVHASGSGQLQANPHVAGPWLSPGKPTRKAVYSACLLNAICCFN